LSAPSLYALQQPLPDLATNGLTLAKAAGTSASGIGRTAAIKPLPPTIIKKK